MRDIPRLVNEGLGNNDIVTRLFVSPRTVQTDLTHVYTKARWLEPMAHDLVAAVEISKAGSVRRARS